MAGTSPAMTVEAPKRSLNQVIQQLSLLAPTMFFLKNGTSNHLFCVPRVRMSEQPKPPSERAHKRAVGKIRRELLIKRRETYFDLLVSGYSVEQIASHTEKSPSAIRRAIGQALAKRQFDAPEDCARLQVARLTKALR
jgi:DNA-binding NarL/FixJ family response regulator